MTSDVPTLSTINPAPSSSIAHTYLSSNLTMASFHPFPATSTILIFAFPLLLLSLLWISKSASKNINKRKTAPEAGGAWPVIGHLLLLQGPQPPHLILANMADKYGRIFTIRLGVRRALVVSSWEIAKECLTTNDKAFAGRPKTANMELLGYNNAMIVFAPYGPYWRQVRRCATTELLSNHRLGLFKQVRESEIEISMQQLYQLCNKNKLVDMTRWFRDVTLNMSMRIIVGKRIPSFSGRDETQKKLLNDFFEVVGKFVVSDVLPFMGWLDIGGDKESMRKIAKELDRVAEGWLQEHKRKRDEDEANNEQDLMGVMLSVLRDSEEYDADTINKATTLALILAAEDTTSITMTWALSLLLNNRNALNKVQQELNIHVGKDRLLVKESDTKNLVYLRSVIKETLRLYPAAPLSVIHEAIEDCTVNGYHVSADTWFIINLQKIHRDPLVWENPFAFRPERFMTNHNGKDVDVRGHNFELIPFGSGRRMCPGVSFAFQIMQLTLANVLHWFEFETPSSEAVDMREGAGMTSPKATPLEVHITPRLPAFVYNSTE